MHIGKEEAIQVAAADVSWWHTPGKPLATERLLAGPRVSAAGRVAPTRNEVAAL